MAFNGSGVFLRLYSWVNDAAANIKIRADRMDNEMDGFATGLTTCITKNGQTTITAALPMAGFNHTGVGDATSRNQYSSAGQVQDGKLNWVAAGGTADALTAAYAIPVTSLVDGELFYVRAGAANATTTPTFSPSGLTTHTIVKSGGQALAAGDIFGAGHELVLRYNLASTRYELLNPAVVAASPVTDATIVTTDVTTNNVTSTKHGWAPKSPADATMFLNGAATSGYAAVKDSDLSTTDITTNNVSTTKHGFAPKLSNVVTQYLDGTGAYSVPAGTPGGLTVIASGNLSTGSPTVVDITSIPQTYRGLILYIDSASNSVATRALRISVDTGLGVASAFNNAQYTQIAGTTVSNASTSVGSIMPDVVQTAAQATHAIFKFMGYQSGPIKEYSGRYAAAATAGSQWGTAGTMIEGVLIDQTVTTTARTGGIVGIRITWDNVASGVFDGGTYALYGVN